MGTSTALLTLVFGVVLVVSSPVARPNPTYDARLSSLELAIIKCIVETVPGVTKGGGGSYDWSVVQSKSKQLEGAEVEVIQVRERDPDFTGRSGQDGGDGYPDDWNIVRSVSSQLEAKENAGADSQYAGSEGASDDWNIVRSISTELHLDAEEAPVDGSDPMFQLRQGQTGSDGFQANDQILFPGSQGVSGEDESGRDALDDPIGIRVQMHDLPSVMMEQHSFSQPDNFAVRRGGMSEHQESSGAVPQVSGEQNDEGGAIGWSIVRSISSEQEPIDEMTSSGSQQAVSTSRSEAMKGDTDSYDLVQPISTELQPADNEAGEIPASLTEMFPPSEHQTGSWINPPSNAEQPAEVYLPESLESSSLDTQKPCETGHRRVKNICQKVHTFQLKSHLR